MRRATSTLFVLSAILLMARPLITNGEQATTSTTPLAPYRLLISDQLSQKILILEKDNRVSWEYDQPGWVMDGQRLPSGNVLYCWYDPKKKDAGVREVTMDKRIVFEFPIEGECHSVQRLPDGRTLIEDPTHQRLIEVDRHGTIVFELKLQVGHSKTHRIARQCRKLSSGNYLVAQEFDKAVVEYAPDGRVVRRLPVNGMVYSISSLNGGGLLIGSGGGDGIGKSVLELDAQGNPVWHFEPADFPPDTNLEWVVDTQRLPDGNTLIGNFLGHGKGGKGISLLIVTPQKKVIWTLRDPRIVLLARAID